MLLSSIVGARPQFVKLAPMVAALATYPIEHSIVHTGQHYDDEMSGIFFHDLDLPTPTVNLGIGSGPHGWQTAQMLAGIEETFTITRPDLVIVYGDTNSTLAGALAAAKLNIPVAHIEAGLRSYRKDMPEEINRVLSDHVSALLFTTTDTATTNLVREGFWTESIFQVGDVMKDAFIGNVAKMPVALDLGLPPEYAVSTIHRAENMGNRLDEIVSNLEELPIPVIFPAHPRTAKALAGRQTSIRVITPLPYLDMMRLVANATIILTDSGGLQREAYWSGVPCVVLRNETEHIELVESGWSVLAKPRELCRAVSFMLSASVPARDDSLFGDGHAAEKIVDISIRWLSNRAAQAAYLPLTPNESGGVSCPPPLLVLD